MIKPIVTFVFLLYAIVGNSQDSESSIPKHFVYFNPGALINAPSGFQVGYERNVFGKTYFDIQGGPLLYADTPTLNDFNATNRRGVRFQTSLKNQVGTHFRIGPQVLFKWVTMDEKIWLERYDNSFEQLFEIQRYRRTFAFGIDLGWSYAIEDGPILMDISYGLGAQNFKVHYEGQPSDVNISGLSGIGIGEGTLWLPFFNFNIKLKYELPFKG